jgi:hypothetical protein
MGGPKVFGTDKPGKTEENHEPYIFGLGNFFSIKKTLSKEA